MNEQVLLRKIISLLKLGIKITLVKEGYGMYKIQLSKEVKENGRIYYQDQILPLDEDHTTEWKLVDCISYMEIKLLQEIKQDLLIV